MTANVNTYQTAAEDILTILRQKAAAKDDVHLQLHLEAAMWEAAAMNERRKNEINATPQQPDEMLERVLRERRAVDTSTPGDSTPRSVPADPDIQPTPAS